jgi:transcriptional regulator with XRE-family HTH domain
VIEAKEFGASLRRERERRGISLDAIAETTKVSASVLAGLERGDLSRWPSGIFRRAFVRAYATAVGLDAEDTLGEFLGVFPEDGAQSRPRSAAASLHGMRLTLGEPATGADWYRLAGGVVDLAWAACCGGLAWWLGPPEVAGIVALGAAAAWHLAGTMLWGTSPGLRIASRHAAAAPGRHEVPPRSVGADEGVPETAGAAAPEPSRDAARSLVIGPAAPAPPFRGRSARRERRMTSRGDRSGDTRSR